MVKFPPSNTQNRLRPKELAHDEDVFPGSALVVALAALPAQQMVTETRDPAQVQDEDFAKSVKEWTTEPAYFISPLVDHLPKVPGVPSPKDVLGYHIGAPTKLTYYAEFAVLPGAGRGVAARQGRNDR